MLVYVHIPPIFSVLLTHSLKINSLLFEPPCWVSEMVLCWMIGCGSAWLVLSSVTASRRNQTSSRNWRRYRQRKHARCVFCSIGQEPRQLVIYVTACHLVNKMCHRSSVTLSSATWQSYNKTSIVISYTFFHWNKVVYVYPRDIYQ